MTRVITVNTAGDLQKVLRVLDRIHTQLPKLTRQSIRKWGNILAKDTKGAAMTAGITPFTGTLFDTGIRWEQRKKSNTGHLFIRQYGVNLDSMAPHYVNVTKRRTRLFRWARQKGNARIQRKIKQMDNGQISKFSIYVRPHPFIRNGFNRARPKLRPMLNRALNKSINLA